MSRHFPKVRISPDGKIAAVHDGTDHPYPWDGTSAENYSDAGVANWLPAFGSPVHGDEGGPVAAAAGHAFDAWAAVYPPSTGNGEPDMGKVRAVLAGLPPADLELFALAMSDAKDIAWDLRKEKLIAEMKVERESKLIIAEVTVNAKGQVTDFSTVTVHGVSEPLPLVSDNGIRMAAVRIGQALAKLGYRAVPSAPTVDNVDGSGVYRMAVEALDA